jgi:hypothetical protein
MLQWQSGVLSSMLLMYAACTRCRWSLAGASACTSWLGLLCSSAIGSRPLLLQCPATCAYHRPGTCACRGTIAIYTCPATCNVAPQQDQQGTSAYVEEFVWVQPS